MDNCEVKESTYSANLEILVRKSSDLQKSPLEFDVDPAMFDTMKQLCVSLDQLSTLANFQMVSIIIKVLSVSDIVDISSQEKTLLKQECIVADSTGTTKIVLWERNANMFHVNSSYELKGLQVRIYQHQKYLSLSKDEFSMTAIDDIGEVMKSTQQSFSTMETFTNCLIIGVRSLSSFHACYSCNSKVAATSDVLANSSQCGTTQVFANCKERHTARVDIKNNDTVKTISVFSPLLDIFCDNQVTTEALLLHSPFTVSVSDHVANSMT